MGSFLIIVVKLYSYKDSDLGNIQKINIFAIISDLRVWREINLTRIFYTLDHLWKDYTYMHTRHFWIFIRWNWSLYVIECGPQGLTEYDSLRE